MAIINQKYKISYFPIPKVACTTLKKVFFELENDFEFRDFRVNGQPKHIHSFYSSSPFSKVPHDKIIDHKKFCIIREPLSRIVSCYRNRVLYHQELSSRVITEDMRSEGIYPNPSLDDFCLNIEFYRSVSASIVHHTDPITVFLGEDPSYFDKIYSLGDIESFFADLSALTGKKITPYKEQTGGPNVSIGDMSQEAREKIIDFYKNDYDVYANYF
jgi:hypothetical protein